MNELEQSAAKRFGQLFRQASAEAGLSTRDISCRLGVPKRQIEKVGTGERVANTDLFGGFLQITEPREELIDSLGVAYGILVERGFGIKRGEPQSKITRMKINRSSSLRNPLPIHPMFVRQGVPITLSGK